MSVAIITGSGGLIGSETARFLHEQGMDVVGVDNNMREYFFGALICLCEALRLGVKAI